MMPEEGLRIVINIDSKNIFLLVFFAVFFGEILGDVVRGMLRAVFGEKYFSKRF